MKNSNNWIDKTLYPFKNNYIQLSAGRMHYVDEGEGEVILFVHGTPTWSFLYRNYIKEFSKTNRVIAIDHIGFGLSDKPTDFAGTPEAHSNNLEEFINKLGLENITLVVHDFGGPIGLSFAIRQPAQIKKIVLFNTWLWETKHDPRAQKVDKILHNWFGNFLYLNTNFSPNFLLKGAFFDKNKLSKKVHQHYKKPFPNKKSRYGLLNIGKSLVGASDWYHEQFLQLEKIENIRTLILWGTKDEFILMEHLERWKGIFKNHISHKYEAGHFVQEEFLEESLNEIKNFID